MDIEEAMSQSGQGSKEYVTAAANLSTAICSWGLGLEEQVT